MGVLALTGGKPVLSSSFPWPIWDDAERQALLNALESGQWGCLTGDRVAEFEGEFAKYHDAGHCICASSGTAALETAMMAWGIAVGDEVIIPAYTFVATASAVQNIGAVPVFADIDRDTYNIDPKSAEEKMTEKTKAIIAVHIGGNPANLDGLRSVAESNGLLLLEDAAQSAGAVYGGRKVGAIGHMGCFSFQATKNLNCGEGGAILTDHDELAAKCRSVINCGRPDPRYRFRVPGTNFRMTEFQAAVLLAQLSRFDEQSALRDSNYRILEEGLRRIPGIVPARKEQRTDRRGCHLFMFGYDREAFGGLSREALVSALNAEGVPCCCGYEPLYRNELFSLDAARYPEFYRGNRRGPEYPELRLPATEFVCGRSVWIFQQVLLGTRAEMELIIRVVEKVREHQAELSGTKPEKAEPAMPSV